MFKDLALLVHEQGQMLNTIEENVLQAADYLEGGEKELVKAKKWYQQARTVIL
jgi:t-SNARE complex subunit (syntaxin)